MTSQISFKNPPIIELICGVQYDIANYNFILESDFYSQVKQSYPIIEVNQPLGPVFDKFSKVLDSDYEPRPPFFKRYFFIDETRSKLIQLQEGRYLFNWRKLEGQETIYPTFRNVYNEFYANWSLLEKVFQSHKIEYSINQLELTYIDHIPVEEFNPEIAKIDDIFVFFNNTGQLNNINSLNIGFSIPINDLFGHINIKLNTAIRKKDQKGVIVLDSTLRGMMGNKINSIDEWFSKAHDLTINLFVELLTDNAKQKWGINK